MSSIITSGERAQLASFLEKFSVNAPSVTKTGGQTFRSIHDSINRQKFDAANQKRIDTADKDVKPGSRVPHGLEDSAYAKHLDKIFSPTAELDIKLSELAQRILKLTGEEPGVSKE